MECKTCGEKLVPAQKHLESRMVCPECLDWEEPPTSDKSGLATGYVLRGTMKIERIDSDKEVDKKVKRVEISNHGITYTITSDFLGIRVTNDHDKGIVVHPACKNEIVIK